MSLLPSRTRGRCQLGAAILIGACALYALTRPVPSARAAASPPPAQLVVTQAAAPIVTPAEWPTVWQLLANVDETTDAEAAPPTTVEPPTEAPPDDLSLLNEAIVSGDVEVVRAMIATGFPVNADPGTGRAPLDVALEGVRVGSAASKQIVELLVSHGAVPTQHHRRFPSRLPRTRDPIVAPRVVDLNVERDDADTDVAVEAPTDERVDRDITF